MKKIVKVFGLIVSASLILTSCGGSSSESETSENQEVAEDESNGDCDQFLEDYEDFADSYIDVLEKMQEDPTDASALSEYTSSMSKLSEIQASAQDCSGDPEFASKMAEITMKISNAAM